MKTLLLPALATAALSFNATAALNNVKFVGADQTETTQICLAAAKEGVESAINLAQSFGFAKSEAKLTICNGERLYNFAKKFDTEAAQEPVRVAKKVIAANQNSASQICADAATHSIEFAEEKYGDVSDVFCNGRTIERFVKRFQL